MVTIHYHCEEISTVVLVSLIPPPLIKVNKENSSVKTSCRMNDFHNKS